MTSGFNSLGNIFGTVMVVVVLGGAVAFTFTDFMEDRLFGTKRTIFIFILVAYGIYRIIRLRQSFKQSRYED